MATTPTVLDFLLTAPSHTRSFAADARYLADGQPKPVVVFVHGFKGFKDWGHFNLLADYFAEQGFVFVKLNLSHNGVVPGGSGDLEDMEAFGQNNFSIELDDLGALLDALHQPGATPLPAAELDLSRLFLIGHSRGGGLVMLKAAEDPRVTAVAGWAPMSDYNQRYPAEVMRQWQTDGVQYIDNARTGQRMPLYYQLVENFEANRERLDIPMNVRTKLRQPLFIIHGDQDETLPLRMAHDLQSWKPDAELVILPGGNHSFGGGHPWAQSTLPAQAQEVADRTLAFFRSLG